MAASSTVHDLAEARAADDRRSRMAGIDAQLAKSDRGATLGCISNLILIIGQDPVIAGLCAYDEFSGRPVIRSAPPSPIDGIPPLPGPFPRQWGAADVSHIQSYVQRVWTRQAARSDTEDAMLAVASLRRFHPVRDWIDGLAWDGAPRLDTWLKEAFGAPNDDYHASVGAKLLIAAVRRVRHPGCKFDYMPIFEGPQGIGKSRTFRVLFGEHWITDSLPSALESMAAAQALQGTWLVEFAEIEQIIRNEVEVIKAFLSRQVDRFRPQYGRAYLEFPRQSVLVGTTNDNNYLRDSTGNRRFWPVQCQWADTDWVAEVREQLFAEAAYREMSGEAIWLHESTVASTAERIQSERLQDDVWDDRIATFTGNRRSITIPEILNEALVIPIERQTKREQMRVADILKRNGWRRTTRREGAKVVKRWERVDT